MNLEPRQIIFLPLLPKGGEVRSEDANILEIKTPSL